MNWLKKLFQNAITREDVDAKIRAAIGCNLLQNTAKLDALEAIWFKNIQKLEINDGDALFIQCKHRLSAQGYINLREAIREILNNAGHSNTPVVLLDDGMEMGVLTKGE
jgi:hypothetical protein